MSLERRVCKLEAQIQASSLFLDLRRGVCQDASCSTGPAQNRGGA